MLLFHYFRCKSNNFVKIALERVSIKFSDTQLKYVVTILFLLLVGSAVFFSCAKWHDPAPTNDPRLTNPYCNDPAAVNYNWGFPGKPDNSICFYPSSLFLGQYMLYDSMYRDTLFLGADSFMINISGTDTSHTRILLSGYCPGYNISLTALPGYQATVDTVVGDTATATSGQIYPCGGATRDTLNGIISRDRLDSPTVLHISFSVTMDTSGIVTHNGTAKKM